MANYLKRVDGCVALANNIIFAYEEVRVSLRLYHMNIASFKMVIMRMPNNVPEKAELLNELYFLEQSALDLDVTADEAMLLALGELSLRFKGAREAIQVVHELMHETFECFMPALIESQQDIDEVYTRLVACCAIEEDVLGALGITLNRY
ncbi:hypothetical protein [Pseudomonas syringae]|uniref:hypothetical protein n=1 Tax=Pseudomonas syringae TaxID=317 RepID=UPI0012AEDC89|nr:hypothetical protein [Pseudomonas syringae]